MGDPEDDDFVPPEETEEIEEGDMVQPEQTEVVPFEDRPEDTVILEREDQDT